MYKCGFTLVELLVVIVIIALLASIAIPTYIKTVEGVRDKAAISSLQLIRAGEKIYQLEVGFYYPFSGTIDSIANINDNLNLDLDPDYDDDPTRLWDYYIDWYSATDFEAKAQRMNAPLGYSRTWYIRKDMTEPTLQ
jgi:prepilin-type N-terminal cleavage/methylation domain-containing protein